MLYTRHVSPRRELALFFFSSISLAFRPFSLFYFVDSSCIYTPYISAVLAAYKNKREIAGNWNHRVLITCGTRSRLDLVVTGNQANDRVFICTCLVPAGNDTPDNHGSRKLGTQSTTYKTFVPANPDAVQRAWVQQAQKNARYEWPL